MEDDNDDDKDNSEDGWWCLRSIPRTNTKSHVQKYANSFSQKNTEDNTWAVYLRVRPLLSKIEEAEFGDREKEWQKQFCCEIEIRVHLN